MLTIWYIQLEQIRYLHMQVKRRQWSSTSHRCCTTSSLQRLGLTEHIRHCTESERCRRACSRPPAGRCSHLLFWADRSCQCLLRQTTTTNLTIWSDPPNWCEQIHFTLHTTAENPAIDVRSHAGMLSAPRMFDHEPSSWQTRCKMAALLFGSR